MRKRGATMLGAGLCPSCHSLFELDVSQFAAYFGGASAICPQCTRPFDLWGELLGHLRLHDVFGTALRLAGARTLMVSEPIAHDEVKEVDLTVHGMPADAEILALELRAEGGGLAGALHGQQALPDPVRGPKLVIFARPMISLVRGGGSVEIIATWFVRGPNDLTMDHVVEAARHFRAGRYVNMVVPAHIAAETAIAPVVARGLARRGPNFERQLDDSVPDLATRSGAPDLTRQVREVLHRLRRRRNDIAHSGTCVAPSRDEAAEFLMAATFALRYARLLGACVDAALTAGRLP